jgi:hypothetical protein
MAKVEGQLRRTGKRAAVRSRSWKGSLGTDENKDLGQEAYHGVPGSRTVKDSSDGYHGQAMSDAEASKQPTTLRPSSSEPMSHVQVTRNANAAVRNFPRGTSFIDTAAAARRNRRRRPHSPPPKPITMRSSPPWLIMALWKSSTQRCLLTKHKD